MLRQTGLTQAAIHAKLRSAGNPTANGLSCKQGVGIRVTKGRERGSAEEKVKVGRAPCEELKKKKSDKVTGDLQPEE